MHGNQNFAKTWKIIMKSLSTLKLLHPQFDTNYLLPFYTASVKAGFSSPAEDYIDSPLDLNAYLIAHPVATFYVRVSNNAMQDAGIYENDLLIVDKSLKPHKVS